MINKLCLFYKKPQLNKHNNNISNPLPKLYQYNQPKPDWVINEVIRLKALLGNKAGCRTVANTFNRLHQNSHNKPMTVGKSFVAETIKKNQYHIAVQRRNIRNKQPRWFAVNDTWAMDVSFYYANTLRTTGAIATLIHCHF